MWNMEDDEVGDNESCSFFSVEFHSYISVLDYSFSYYILSCPVPLCIKASCNHSLWRKEMNICMRINAA